MSNWKGYEFLVFGALLFVVFILLALWIGKKAKEKGYSRVGFTIFALFLPVIALIVVLVIQPTQAAQDKSLVKCSQCAEAIQPQAKRCKHCGIEIPLTLINAPSAT